ncbi:amino acid/amide ABC transporter membrane protein 2 (HAAT family) [Bosea sp. AK1]|uniref:branched-chain amino acid ABC transporter permease n=1 Tax=Bosea sp. AK1 TaxID=2587160 RepID=UPI001153A890|nr:branched-chain amino acid ABC transporter permease [Bosea sp. AK1]TQI65285.1 amino acid/amide ABC transporter membrane protein 2 (HAAT family) [Bosea sp. AK1]
MLSYFIFIATVGGIYGLLALGLNLVWGTAGMANLGLAGFFALGGYATAVLTGAGAPVFLGMLFAVGIGIAAGLLVTAATLRLRDDYLAIVTLGFAEVLRLVALNERWLTRGAEGYSGIPTPFKQELGPFGFNAFYLGFVLLILVIALLLLRRLDVSPYGRALKSIREDQELAAFAGKRVKHFKFVAFSVAAAISALAGALYAHFQSYISPDHFQPLLTIYIFLAVSAGGVGRPTGVVIGAFAVIFYLEATRFMAGAIPHISAVQAAAMREMLVGAALIAVLRWKPAGLFPEQIPKAGFTATSQQATR